jgi:cytochrome P450
MRTAAEEVIAAWREGERLEVDRVMNDLAVTALTRSLFRFTPSAETAEAIKRGMHALTQGLLLRTVMPTTWERVPTPGNLRFRRAMARMHRAIDGVIRDYREAGEDRGDVLSALLAARDEDGQALTDAGVHAQVMTLALTGIEAPGAALGWMMHQIGRDPRIAEQVHAEIDTVLGRRAPAHEDLERLTYLRRVIDEVLRLRTPLVFMRRTLTEVELGGVTIPADSEVVYSPYLLHHDARWFADPERFDPDRWLPENSGAIPKGAFIPFAAGAYQCIGKLFATTELAVVTATICAHWRLEPVPGAPVREMATALVRPSQLPMTAHRRRSA